MALHRRIILCMFSKLLAILGITVLLASATDVPPKALVLENFRKASVIVKGIIETSNAPRPGVTVANFLVSRCYRGSFKPGDAISYASFREGDSYSSEYLHTDLIVFLRKRSPHFAPPDWETATDLSEFLYSSDLEATLPTCRRTRAFLIVPDGGHQGSVWRAALGPMLAWMTPQWSLQAAKADAAAASAAAQRKAHPGQSPTAPPSAPSLAPRKK